MLRLPQSLTQGGCENIRLSFSQNLVEQGIEVGENIFFSCNIFMLISQCKYTHLTILCNKLIV